MTWRTFCCIFEVRNPLATTVVGTSSDSNADNFERLPLPFLEVDVVRTSLLSKSLWTFAVVWLRQGNPEKPDDIAHHESQPNLVAMKIGFRWFWVLYRMLQISPLWDFLLNQPVGGDCTIQKIYFIAQCFFSNSGSCLQNFLTKLQTEACVFVHLKVFFSSNLGFGSVSADESRFYKWD